MKLGINEETIKHIKKLLGVKHVEIVKNFSYNLQYKDYKENFYEGDWESCCDVSIVTEDRGDSPFHRINELCIVYDDNDRSSLITYKGFAIDGEDVTFVKDDVSYIFKDMDKHLLTNGHRYGYWNGHYVRELDVFIKDNSLYAATYLNEKKPKIDIKGKVIPSTLGGRTFYTVEGNTVYVQEIVTGKEDKYGEYHEYNDYIALKSRVFHKDEKEIADVEFVDLTYKNEGYITDAPNIVAAIIIFTDGTKRLLVKNEKGKKACSRYFKDLKLSIAALHITKDEFEKETPKNKESWNYGYNDTDYFVSGLTFDYITDKHQGEFIVKNDGHMMVKSRKSIRYQK